MKSTEKMISVGELTTCPWNPRGEITPESVKDLTASIQARGLLQNIGVWKRPDAPGYYVIFGNRRFVACVNAMLAEVRCRVFECSEVEAHELTRIENEARLGVSPIEDAKLVGKMLDLGYNGKEIAAHFGVSEAHITRRRKLLDLSRGWEARARELDIPTDALEHVAAYPADVQDRVLAKASSWDMRDGWSSIKRWFNEITADLDRCPFVKHDKGFAASCQMCPKRSGATPDLFDGMPDGELGRCLDPKCFKKKREAWHARLLDDAIPGEIKERISVWEDELKYANGLVPKPCDGKRAAYYWIDDEKGKVVVKYGPSKAEVKKAQAEERARRDKKDKEDKARLKLIEGAKTKIKRWWKAADLKKLTLAAAGGEKDMDPWVLIAIEWAICLSLYAQDSRKCADTIVGAKNKFEAWWTVAGHRIREKFTGYVDLKYAVAVERFYPDEMKALTKEERAAVLRYVKERR